MKGNPNLFLAGQITGVEGYMESAATGILAGISLLARLKGRPFFPPGADTALGALIHYITDRKTASFQPTNTNFGIMEQPDVPKKGRAEVRSERADLSFRQWLKGLDDVLRREGIKG